MNLFKKFAAMVSKLIKPPQEVRKTLTDSQINLIHCALGVATEAGEIATIIKEHVIYGKPLDTVALVKEIGDETWYTQGLLNELKLTLDVAIEHNMVKLAERYGPDYDYTDQKAIDKADQKGS